MSRSGDDAPAAACLSESRVIEFISGSVAENDRRSVEEHLDGCEACFDWVAQLVRASLLTSQRGYEETLPLSDSGGAEPGASVSPGQIVGRYEILEPLGRGAMGVVFRALDTLLQRPVALKVIRGTRPSTSVKLRALREAQALAKLDHPNAVGVHDIGFFDDEVFVAMELVDGETLADWLRRERRSWREIRDVFLQAGRGLAAAHAAGLVHRDFKPDNVLLSSDGRRVVVTDFGLVCSLDVDGESGADAEVAGTPAYMAPEQFAAGPIDVRTDVFNFCACLYEALFGCPAFEGRTLGERRREVLAGRVRRPPPEANVPRWLTRLVMRGLSRAPGERPASMLELLSDMELDRRARRRGLVAGAVGLIVMLVVIAAGVASYRNPAAACRRRALDVGASWSPAIRRRVERAFERTGASFATRMKESVASALQIFLDAWSAAYSDTCDATYQRGAQSMEAFEQRVECLDAQRDGFDRLVELLQQADRTVVENAAHGAFALDDPRRCLRERLSPTLMVPPHLKRDVERTRHELRTARSYELLGKYDDADRIAKAALPEARALGFSPLLAETWERIGFAERYRGKWSDAEASLRAAFDAAERSADDGVRAAVATELVDVVGVRLGRAPDGEHWSELADAILGRLGDPELERATLALNRGLLRETESKLDLAVADFKAAYDVRRSRLPANDPLVPLALGELALAAYAKGQYEDAGRMLRETYALLEGSVGETHPVALAYKANLGSVEFALGRFRKAREIWQEVLAAQEQALGPTHGNVIQTRDSIVAAEIELGEYDAAKTHAREVLALATRDDKNGPLVAHYDLNLAFACLGRGDFDEARRYALDALARREAKDGPNSPAVGRVELQIAQMAVDTHRWSEVRPHGERALELLTRGYGRDHVDVATALDVLGAADYEAGELAAAIAKHERAVAIFRKAKHHDLPIALTSLGRAQLAAGRTDAAIATLEEAQRLRQSVEGDRQERAATAFALARAIAVGNPRRAKALATGALDDFAAGGPRFRSETEEVRHWLEGHH